MTVYVSVDGTLKTTKRIEKYTFIRYLNLYN